LLVQTGARASENAEGARTTPSVVAITNATNDPPTTVTAPTYFNDAQRQATEGTGRTACPGVLQATNEFTLAALASGPDRLDLSPLALANESDGLKQESGRGNLYCGLTIALLANDRRAQRCREAQWGSVSCKEQKPQAPRRFSPVSCTPSLPTYSAALQAEGASSYQYPLVSRQFLA
ncbi:hypothetical protein BD779DRAFT_1694871, partial [Infundibulicybe gibba]